MMYEKEKEMDKLFNKLFTQILFHIWNFEK